MTDDALAPFQEHRPVLFGIAYRMLGSAADAEDILQDAWLKWSRVDTSAVAEPRAYLARTVTNLSLDRLTSAAVQRESYVGTWLPEPLVTAPGRADRPEGVESGVERAEDVSLALLVVLESLSPLERAVFVLKEAFGFAYAEIAGMLGRTEPAVRQVGSRARAHVQAGRPRYEAPPEVRRRVTDEFLAACVGGDLNQMMAMLAPDVTVWTDGGGKIRAALRPLYGADKAARWILGVMGGRPIPDMGVHRVDVNGQPGLMITSGDSTDSVMVLELDDTGITEIRMVRNPDKLTHITPPKA